MCSGGSVEGVIDGVLRTRTSLSLVRTLHAPIYVRH